MSSTPIPKSLHTVTVLVQVARHLMEGGHLTPAVALDDTMNVLKLNYRLDTHNLRASALKQLEG